MNPKTSTTVKTLSYYEQKGSDLAIKYASRLVPDYLAYLDSQITPANNVLDLGCGSARDLYHLKRLHPDTFFAGLDGSFSLLKSGGLYHSLQNPLMDPITLIHWSAPDPLPFLSDRFELIISSAFLHHFEEDQIRFLIQEIRRVLADQGNFVTAVGRRKSWSSGAFTDKHGRFYNNMSDDKWLSLFKSGFRSVQVIEEQECFLKQSEDIQWTIFRCR